MDEGIAILIAGGFGVFSPIILNFLQNRTRRAERVEDFERQDRVAAKVDAVKQQATEAVEITALTAAKTEAHLTHITTLVNSTLTAAQQGHLDQARQTLGAAREVVDLIKASGGAPTDEQLERVTTTEANIKALETTISDRMVQQAEADQGDRDAADLAELTRRQNL
jgi:hypothetical protein